MDDPFSRLQWRHLRLISMIGDTGQISFAADRLGVSQPAASRSLAEIEAALGHRLFDRVPKGMVPTPVGEVLLRRSSMLLQGLTDAMGEVREVSEGRKGTVRVGSVTGPALTYVVPAAQELNAEGGGADIRVDVGTSLELSQGLMAGDYDFVLARLPAIEDARRLTILRGRSETVEFLCRRDHPLAGQGPLPLDRLAGYGWVIQGPGTPIRVTVEDAFAGRRVPIPTEILTTASLLLSIAYLAGTDTLAPVSSEVSAMLSSPLVGGLAALRPAQPIEVMPFHLYHLADRQMSMVAQRMLALISDRMTRG